MIGRIFFLFLVVEVERDIAVSSCPRYDKGMNGQERINIRPGLLVSIVQKQHQGSGELTEGIVQDILTNSPTHPRGIKVRLQTGEVGRVQVIHAEERR